MSKLLPEKENECRNFWIRFVTKLNALSGGAYKLVREKDGESLKPERWHIIRKEEYGEEVFITILRKKYYDGWRSRNIRNRIVAEANDAGYGNERIRERRINSDFDQIKDLDKAAKNMNKRCNAMMDEIHEHVDVKIRHDAREKELMANIHFHFPDGEYSHARSTCCSYETGAGKHSFDIHAKGEDKYSVFIGRHREFSPEQVKKLLAVLSSFKD